MQEFVKSCSSLALALALFGIKEVENVLTPMARGARRGEAANAMDAVTHATIDQFGETLRSSFRSIDHLQRGLISLGFNIFFPAFGQDDSRRGHYRSGHTEEEWDARKKRRNVHVSNRVVNAEEALTRAS